VIGFPALIKINQLNKEFLQQKVFFKGTLWRSYIFLVSFFK